MALCVDVTFITYFGCRKARARLVVCTKHEAKSRGNKTLVIALLCTGAATVGGVYACVPPLVCCGKYCGASAISVRGGVHSVICCGSSHLAAHGKTRLCVGPPVQKYFSSGALTGSIRKEFLKQPENLKRAFYFWRAIFGAENLNIPILAKKLVPNNADLVNSSLRLVRRKNL